MQWLFLTYCVCRFLMKLFTVFFLFFCFQKLELLFTRKRVRLLPTVVDLVAVWLITDRCLPAFPDLFVLGFLQAVLKKSKNAIVWSVSARDSSWCRADLLVCRVPHCSLCASLGLCSQARRRMQEAGKGWLRQQQHSPMRRPDASRRQGSDSAGRGHKPCLFPFGSTCVATLAVGSWAAGSWVQE